MPESQRSRGGANRDNWYTIRRQRVKHANFSVRKDGVLERPGPSWSDRKMDALRSQQAEPWNVENVNLTSKGIEIFQYAQCYNRSDSQKGPKVRVEDLFAWSVVFKPKSMQAICVREFQALANDKHKRPSTFIEICFKYEGLPESKDSTQLMTEQPEEGECTDEEGQIVESALAKGGEVEKEKVQEVATEDENDEEEEDEDELRPDQFDLAKLFAGPNDFKDLDVRVAFLRSSAKQGRWQWQWPAVFSFLRGFEGWTPHTKIQETQHQFGLSLNDWVLQCGNKSNQSFVALPQEDGTTKWAMRSVAWVSSQSGSSQGSRKRTLAEIEAQDDELEREEERLGRELERVKALRKQLKEERKQAYQG